MLMQIFGDKQGALWEMWNWCGASNQFSALLASSPGCFGGGAKLANWLRTNFSTSIFQTFQTEVLKGLKGFVVKCFLVKQACSTEQINK